MTSASQASIEICGIFSACHRSMHADDGGKLSSGQIQTDFANVAWWRVTGLVFVE